MSERWKIFLSCFSVDFSFKETVQHFKKDTSSGKADKTLAPYIKAIFLNPCKNKKN